MSILFSEFSRTFKELLESKIMKISLSRSWSLSIDLSPSFLLLRLYTFAPSSPPVRLRVQGRKRSSPPPLSFPFSPSPSPHSPVRSLALSLSLSPAVHLCFLLSFPSRSFFLSRNLSLLPSLLHARMCARLLSLVRRKKFSRVHLFPSGECLFLLLPFSLFFFLLPPLLLPLFLSLLAPSRDASLSFSLSSHLLATKYFPSQGEARRGNSSSSSLSLSPSLSLSLLRQKFPSQGEIRSSPTMRACAQVRARRKISSSSSTALSLPGSLFVSLFLSREFRRELLPLCDSRRNNFYRHRERKRRETLVPHTEENEVKYRRLRQPLGIVRPPLSLSWAHYTCRSRGSVTAQMALPRVLTGSASSATWRRWHVSITQILY